MSRHTLISLAAALAACLLAPALLQAAMSKEDMAALVNQIPDADKDGRYTGPAPDAAQKIYGEILKGGKDNVLVLIGLLTEPGTGADYKARYILHGMVTCVNRPDMAEQRQVVVDALLAALPTAKPKGVQDHILEELRCVGGKDSAARISEFLADDELCAPAAMALINIGGTEGIFRQALPAAKGRNRVTIIQALGRLRDTQAVPELTKAAADADREVRFAAIDALGNIGAPAALDTLLAASDAAKEHWDRTKTVEAVLVLAKRLREAGNAKDAERIYQRLWETRTDLAERHVRIAALEGLAAARGDMADLLAAMKTGDPQIRAVAVRLATATPGQAATMKCVEAMQKAPPTDRASLLVILGARGDAAAMPAILAMFKFPDEQVRGAAMQAAAAIGGTGAVEALVAAVTGPAGKDRDAAVDALAKIQGKEANGAVASAMAKASDPAVRAALLGVLAARRASDQTEAITEAVTDKDVTVRAAAIKALGALAREGQLPAIVKILKETKDAAELAAAQDALVATCGRQLGDKVADLVSPALTGAAPANTAAMIRVLGATGNRKALGTVLGYTGPTNSDAALKEAAVRAVADWPNRDAAGPLAEIAKTSADAKHQVLAVRGIIRLASAKGLSADDRTALLAAALGVAKRQEEKREALAGLSGVQSVGSLKTAAACLDDDSVKEEAAAAVVQIAEKVAKQNPDEVRDAVTKALQATKNARVKSDGEKILARVKK